MLNFSYPCLLSLVEIIEEYCSFTPLSSWLPCWAVLHRLSEDRSLYWLTSGLPEVLRTLERVRGLRAGDAAGVGGVDSAAALRSTVGRTFLWQSRVSGPSPVCILVSVPSLIFSVCSFITTENVCVAFFSLHLKADFSPGTQPTRPQGALGSRCGPGAVGAVRAQSVAVSTYTVTLSLGKTSLSQ